MMSEAGLRMQAELRAVLEALLRVAVAEIARVFEGSSCVSSPCAPASTEITRTGPKPARSIGVQTGDTPGKDGAAVRGSGARLSSAGAGCSPHEILHLEPGSGASGAALQLQMAEEESRNNTTLHTELNPQEEAQTQESGSIIEREVVLLSAVTEDLHTAALSPNALCQSDHKKEGISISFADYSDQARPQVDNSTAGCPFNEALANKTVAAVKVKASSSVKKVKFQLSQTPFDCKLMQPCSVQLVNLLLVSRAKKRTDINRGKRRPLPKDLQVHQGAHTGRRLCCFSNCGDGVWRLQRGECRGHLRRCGVCGKQFRRRKLLRRHERFHTGEKPYSCPSCARSFTLRKSLKRHERFHTGERPHACTQCSKCFRLRDSLRAHLRFHTGEKPFTCPLCTKRFRIRKNLQKHTLTHTAPATTFYSVR